jgi:tetratricopeptide (TPR) repeat protein
LREGVGEDDPLRTEIDVILGRASAALRLARQEPATADVEAVLARHAADADAAMRQSQPAIGARANSDTAPGGVSAPPRTLEEVVTSPPPMDVVEPRGRRRPAEQTLAPVRGADDSLPPAAGPGSSGFEGRAQIEHLLMEAEVRMNVADYANAVKVYEKLVERAPNVAAFHLRLAVAMACYPRTSKAAEREYYEAARLEPDNADIHYQWGLYYKLMKVRSRAVAEMRTAVRLNPKHKNARAELEALSPKDSALTSLKKLFR